MLEGMTITPRVVLARGVLASLAPAGSSFVTEPTHLQDLLVWDSDPNPEQGLIGKATRFRRLFFGVKCSHNGTIRFSGSFDGVNYDLTEDTAYTANDAAVVVYSVKTPWIRARFVDAGGSGSPTTWRAFVMGDESSADSGA